MGNLVAEKKFDELVTSISPPTNVFAVKIKAGEGELKRGTVLARSAKDGTMVILGSAAGTGDTLTANCILAEDVDATAAANGLAYRTGHFATNKLIAAEDYEITANDKEALRDVGILLSDAVEF